MKWDSIFHTLSHCPQFKPRLQDNQNHNHESVIPQIYWEKKFSYICQSKRRRPDSLDLCKFVVECCGSIWHARSLAEVAWGSSCWGKTEPMVISMNVSTVSNSLCLLSSIHFLSVWCCFQRVVLACLLETSQLLKIGDGEGVVVVVGGELIILVTRRFGGEVSYYIIVARNWCRDEERLFLDDTL